MASNGNPKFQLPVLLSQQNNNGPIISMETPPISPTIPLPILLRTLDFNPFLQHRTQHRSQPTGTRHR